MRKMKKVMALGCLVLLVTANVCGCGMQAQAMEQSEEEKNLEELQNAVEEFAGSSDIVRHSSTAGKEETVYAILDADGNPVETIVSEWLKNQEGSEDLSDVTELKDIFVVKGDSEYTTDGGNKITWQTGGSDVYYQGTTAKELPVKVSIQYELDGNKVEASDLEGASGHLKMTFSYENNTAKEVTVAGEKCIIYQPFVMLSGLILDNEKATNVRVENGNAVNNGDSTMVFGIAMPGLKESLGISDLKNDDGEKIDIDIPENVVIEADITDFSLLMTLTVASNSALEELGLEDIDSIDDLKADMDELTNGMNDIIDGTTRLDDGMGELSGGTGELSDGVNKLSDGTVELAEGAHKLSEGAAQVNDGAVALKNGLASLKQGTPALAAGIGSLLSGADELSAGLQTIISNNDTLNNGAALVSDGLNALNASLNNAEAQTQLQTLLQGSTDFATGLSSAADGLSQITAGYNYNEGDIANLITGLSAYAEALNASGDPNNMAMAGYIQIMIGTYQGLYDNVVSAAGGVSTLNGQYAGINNGINAAAGNMGTVSNAVGQLAVGAGQLKEGVAGYTAGVSQAASGVNTLDEGLNSLNSQVPSLVGGIDQLVSGANTLASGTQELSSGASTLAGGADELNNGTGELKNGVSSLLNGVAELLDGTGELKDGVIKFNEEGIKKLADLVNEDLEKYYDRLCALKDYAREYSSFAGCEEGTECSVKFIYKTDSIGD
ncbi:MAG: hypothetical protein PUF12_02710 [Thermoflexaceae bacterium]|nr:hypothetical protein [Thermoflexaceae bacterium]